MNEKKQLIAKQKHLIEVFLHNNDLDTLSEIEHKDKLIYVFDSFLITTTISKSLSDIMILEFEFILNTDISILIIKC